LKVPDSSTCVSSSFHNAACWTITGSHSTKPGCSNGLLCTNNVLKILVSRKYETKNLCVSRSGLYRKHL